MGWVGGWGGEGKLTNDPANFFPQELTGLATVQARYVKQQIINAPFASMMWIVVVLQT